MTRFYQGCFMLGMVCFAPRLHSASAQTYTVLHAFQGPDGSEPTAGVTLGGDGTIYGTTSQGGPYPTMSGGVVFRSDSSGIITTLHAFDLTDGQGPTTPTLLKQTLYGSAVGTSSACGVLYSVKTDGSDFSDFYAFGGNSGCGPIGKLQWSPGQGFAGVTAGGGPAYKPGGQYFDKGVLFVLTQGGDYRVLHDFGKSGDGMSPTFVVVDNAGNIYGSTFNGGAACALETEGCGTIFKFNIPTKEYSIIYTFTGLSDGANPILGSIGSDGTLYGVTQNGTGTTVHGTLFAMKPSAGGYTLTTLTDLGGRLGSPTSGPTLTADNRLIGVTDSGLYAYNLNQNSLTILEMLNTVATGSSPSGQPAVAKNGSIYGTTAFGGEPPCEIGSGCGVLYQYSAP